MEINSRQEQNITGVIFIFIGIYLFFQNYDFLSLGITWILGFGISQDVRNFIIFIFKYLFAKLSKKQTPTYDFSKAKIKQNSGRDSIINYGTIIQK
jgi:hypothetical protein